jgi:L-threonylcarbamoyladenylate synthase
MIRVPVSSEEPEPEALARAAAVIHAGGVVALPTDTLYGLAVDAFNEAAVRRVFAVKGRPLGRALPLIASEIEQVTSLLGPLTSAGRTLVQRFWPGPLTIVVAAPSGLSEAVTGGTGGVGVRVPAHRVARGLCQASDRLLTATSANVSGQSAPAHPDAIDPSLQQVDILLDGGPAPGGLPSTIVDVRHDVVSLVRAGAIPWEEIKAWVAAA